MCEVYPYALGFDRYRELLAADARRLRQLAPAVLDRDVPDCPGWKGADVVRHTAEVYLHKTEVIALQDLPKAWPPAGIEDADPLSLFDHAWGRLAECFDSYDPAAPAPTWWPPDQTVGFWMRRMAHETSVHCRDVEGAGRTSTAIDTSLAIDGIDEALMLMLGGGWSALRVATGAGSRVAVSGGGYRWEVALRRQRIDVSRGVSGEPVTTVAGQPSQLLLWLWGRAPTPDVDGERAKVMQIRDLLTLMQEWRPATA